MGTSRKTFALIVGCIIRVGKVRISCVRKANKRIRLQEISAVAATCAGMRLTCALWRDL